MTDKLSALEGRYEKAKARLKNFVGAAGSIPRTASRYKNVNHTTSQGAFSTAPGEEPPIDEFDRWDY